jgi:integrase
MQMKEDAPPRAITPEEAMKLIATCDERTPIDLRDRALIIVGLETGMRCMSLAGMRLETIRKCAAGHPIAAVPIKGSKALYEVPLSDSAIAAIEPWRLWLRNESVTKGPVFCALVKKLARSGKLTYEPQCSALSREAIYKIITRRAEKARLKDVNPLTFRTTFITWRMQAGVPPSKIAAVTGHKIPGLGSSTFINYIDIEALGGEARLATPEWLAKLARIP